MAEKNIVITISAKDLSSAELDKARRALAGFSAEAKRSRGSSDLAGGGFLSLGTLARQLTPALTVAGIVTFGKEILADADALVKLSDKTGIAIEPLQRLKYAAEQSGNTFEQITSAVSMMQKRLADGDDSALGALNQLGISFADFRAMTPDQQFTAVAAEVAKIQDPMERVKVATDLFGKSGAEVIPTLIANVKELGDQASVMSRKAAGAFEALGDAISGAWTKTKNTVGEGLSAMADGYGRLFDIFTNVGPHGSFKGLTDALFDLETEIPKVAGAAPKLATATTGVALSMEDADKAGKDLNETLKEQHEQAKKSQAAWKKYSDEFVANIQQQITWQDAEAAQIKTINDILRTEGKSALEGWGRDIETNVTKKLREAAGMNAALFAVIATGITDVRTRWNGFGLAVVTEADRAGGAIQTRIVDGVTIIGPATEKATKSAKTSFGTFSQYAQMALSAVSAAGNKTASAIAGIGGAILSGASMGPWGALAGGVLGSFSAAYDKLAKTEGKKVNDLRDAYFAAAGGFVALSQKLIDAGASAAWDQLWNAKKVKDWEAGVKAADAALAKLATTQGELADIQAQLAGRQTTDWQKGEELANKYGFTLAGLGGQFEAAKLHDGFLELWNDWQTMADMGGNVGGMLAGMKEEIGHLVTESGRLGTELPEQFKGLIQQLIDSKQLFDDNGEAITDISTLKFGAPLVSEVDKIVASIKELVDLLKNGLAPAITGLPRGIDIGVGYKADAPDRLGGGGGWSDTFGLASGGVVTRPRRAWIGEGGQPEIVGSVAFMEDVLDRVLARRGNAGGGASPQIIVQPRIYLDGRELTKGIAPWLPGEVKAYGLA